MSRYFRAAEVHLTVPHEASPLAARACLPLKTTALFALADSGAPRCARMRFPLAAE